ncbi:Putative glutaconate CoA-transferase, beta subunit [Desulfatibacillum aliphaticivorans]|uniref:Glutaconate CoA-transferase, beta subunit n=1 Tax=Desulfatibacillum aliphaticivorans TaxID=218208 RepID=B8FGB6_DESAL|nr:CoA-transferase [Desulfatibacillum aliphaticivorans]ACL03796.1 Putative glutaconate CoA-transferase, beta subunit [Desulfatibacillum aliphaticivorans]
MSDFSGDYIKPELMACCGAREIEDNNVVIVGTGFPTMSANIAKYTHAPNAVLMQESGVIDAQPKRPALSVGDPCLNPGAAMIGGLVDIMGMLLQAGHVDVGFLSGSQVDRFGNINTTVIGPYEAPKTRLPGSGGANPIGCLARKTLIIALHDKRRLAHKVDFITTPGYIDGPGAREKWGMPENTGPHVLITNKAVLRFDKDTKEAYLASYHPGSTIEEIRDNTPWDLQVSDSVHETIPPTEEELRALREKLDPFRMISIYEKKGYV